MLNRSPEVWLGKLLNGQAEHSGHSLWSWEGESMDERSKNTA